MASTPPSAPEEPLTLDEVKLNLRVDGDGEDALIGALITTARMHVENATGLVLLPGVITETVAQLGRWIDLNSWPITSISAVRYPLQGVMTPLDSSAWLVSYKARPVRLLPVAPGWGVSSGYSLPFSMQALPVEIDVQAGYASPDDVPRPVKQAIHLLVAHFYSNRAATEVGARAAAVEIPFGVAELLRPYRVARV